MKSQAIKILCALMLTLSSLHGSLGSEVPTTLTTCAQFIRDAESVPISKVQGDPADSSPPVISREKGLKAFVRQRYHELQRVAADTTALKEAGNAWADDAAVLLGFLYVSTSADPLWAPQAALDQFRALVQRSKPVELDSWTLSQLTGTPRIAHSWNEQIEPDEAKVARIFARQVISCVLLRDGVKGAEEELGRMKNAPYLSPLVMLELSAMVEVYGEGQRAGTVGRNLNAAP